VDDQNGSGRCRSCCGLERRRNCFCGAPAADQRRQWGGLVRSVHWSGQRAPDVVPVARRCLREVARTDTARPADETRTLRRSTSARHSADCGRCPWAAAWSGYARPTGCHTSRNVQDHQPVSDPQPAAMGYVARTLVTHWSRSSRSARRFTPPRSRNLGARAVRSGAII